MPKFCPTCGNSSDKTRFYGNFCEDCTKRKFSEHIKDKVEIIRCKRCGRIRARGVFVPPNGMNLADAIKQHYKGRDVKLIDYSEDSAQIDLSEATENGTVTVQHNIGLDYRKQLCDVCYKKACNYHEAVIQLRGSPDRIESFMEKLTKFFEVHDQFISKIETAEHGLNVYLSSKSLAGAFITRMKLHPETSYTLAGVKNGKRVYKNTYAIRY